jgi:hypothetical protein
LCASYLFEVGCAETAQDDRFSEQLAREQRHTPHPVKVFGRMMHGNDIRLASQPKNTPYQVHERKERANPRGHRFPRFPIEPNPRNVDDAGVQIRTIPQVFAEALEGNADSPERRRKGTD